MSSRRKSRKKKTASPTSPQKGSGTSNANDDGTQVDRSAKKRTARRRRRTTTPPDLPFKQCFAAFVLNTIKAGVPGLLSEFEEIQKQTQAIGATPKTAFDSNPDKNRYKDVYCIDESRVKLAGGGNDYIHANWIDFSDRRRYICTQGPLPATINDFWRLVWQERCRSIAMLCNLVEGGQKKCEQYWPESGEMKYGELKVKMLEKIEFEKIMTITNLKVWKEGDETREIEHFQWHNLPDHGVPADVLAWHSLREKLRLPTVIHCSDGIGRTGTFLGMDRILTSLKNEDLKMGKEILLEVRARRHGAVLTDIQYLYMHRVFVALGLRGKLIKETEVKPFIDAYDALCKQRGCQ